MVTELTVGVGSAGSWPRYDDPDTELMLRVRAGDTGSFEALLARHRNTVIHHLYRLVHNRTVAEELAQDVFVRIYRSRERYEPSAKFTTWLFRITTNVALNWRRDSRREMAELGFDQLGTRERLFELRDRRLTADQELINNDRLNEIRSAIASLPAKQQSAVLMHKYEGMDYAQIAEVLDCSIPALKSLLFRAYETLRKRLAHLA